MFETDRRIYCSHLGESGDIINSRLVDLLQDISNIHLMTHPVLASFFEETGSVMFLTNRQVDIIRRPGYNERVHTKTWTYELNRMYGFRNTVIIGEDGEMCVKSIAGGAFMDLKNGRPMRVSADLISQVKIHEKLDMEYLPRKIAIPDAAPSLTKEVEVRRSDIDMNLHVNNARYLDITDELFEDCAKAKRLRVEYKVPLKRGDKVFGDVYPTENGCIVCLRDENGRTYCTVEYTL